MPQAARVSAGAESALYGEIGFDPALEGLAFRRLAELDVEGCRAAFGRLADQVEFPRTPEGRSLSVLLLADVLHRVNRRLHRSPDGDTEYHANRVEILTAFASCDGADAARKQFVSWLNRLLSFVKSRRGAAHPVVQEAQAFIEDHYQRKIGLSVVARRLHVSASYLSRLFRRETGSTLTEHIHRVRLEHARLLLASGSRSLSEIAFLVGYQTYRDFYRNFVKYEHSSPRQARRRFGDPRTPVGRTGDSSR